MNNPLIVLWRSGKFQTLSGAADTASHFIGSEHDRTPFVVLMVSSATRSDPCRRVKGWGRVDKRDAEAFALDMGDAMRLPVVRRPYAVGERRGFVWIVGEFAPEYGDERITRDHEPVVDPVALVDNEPEAGSSRGRWNATDEPTRCPETHAVYGRCSFTRNHAGDHEGTFGNRMTGWSE